ncbi:hypothetical protein [Nocardia terpenica]|uniref:Excisionase n=1 Tax=Nocardia terpenica TaxID=455432 RepID=A0A164H086_9NOCA|nr:hypothetical protein [Nocardia terpenica]KZM68093.1 hypothetical protein AWN90_09125 [Nocardia terpenica]NQE89053.1 hypothetical protein [Nocardia terpenica]
MTAPDQVEVATFPLSHVVQTTGAASEDWLIRRLRKKQIRGRWTGREWRMTASDMAALVEFMANGPAAPAVPDVTGLTAASRRRLERRYTR